MKDYTSSTPEFSSSIKVLDTATSVHSDNVNVTTKQLLQNTLVNKKSAEEANKTSQEQMQEALRITAAVQSDVDEVQNDLLSVAMVLSTLTDAEVLESNNAAVETFRTANDVIITSGSLDSTNNRLYA